MLYQLGMVTFEVVAPNLHEVEHKAAADFASKDLVGRRRSREFVGEGDEHFSLRGRLFPEKLGGLEALDMLAAMRASGVPQILVRGDGRNMGWYLIETVTDRSSYLGRSGVGKKIEFEISLVRADAPPADAFVGALFNLFG